MESYIFKRQFCCLLICWIICLSYLMWSSYSSIPLVKPSPVTEIEGLPLATLQNTLKVVLSAYTEIDYKILITLFSELWSGKHISKL